MDYFTYTYDLNGDVALKQHPLASGVYYTQKLLKEIIEAQKSPKKLSALINRWEALKAVKSPKLAEQEEQLLLKKAIEHVQKLDTIGTQLAKDIVRPGFDVVFQGVERGNKLVATQTVKEFMQGLTLPQQLLVDQSQGLSLPTTHFLSSYLQFPNSQKINENALFVGQAVFSKSETIVNIMRQDEFYSFNDQSMENPDSGQFYYKIAGQPIQSASISQSKTLYAAIQKAVTERHTQNGFISISYINEEAKEEIIKIEPILSLTNTIELGTEIDSLNWKASVTTYDESVKLDEIFEAGKTEVEPKAKGGSKMKTIAKIEPVVVPEILASMGGGPSEKSGGFVSNVQNWINRHPKGLFLGVCLLAGVGLGLLGGPLGAVVGLVIGGAVGLAVPNFFPGLLPSPKGAISSTGEKAVEEEPEVLPSNNLKVGPSQTAGVSQSGNLKRTAESAERLKAIASENLRVSIELGKKLDREAKNREKMTPDQNTSGSKLFSGLKKKLSPVESEGATPALVQQRGEDLDNLADKSGSLSEGASSLQEKTAALLAQKKAEAERPFFSNPFRKAAPKPSNEASGAPGSATPQTSSKPKSPKGGG